MKREVKIGNTLVDQLNDFCLYVVIDLSLNIGKVELAHFPHTETHRNSTAGHRNYSTGEWYTLLTLMVFQWNQRWNLQVQLWGR